ncbi:MAG: hypothetical protein H6742_19270 [Alphaproteobacteria bacterium]|nr:hypothetical protein [Alphaproteobacteria bacterium]
MSAAEALDLLSRAAPEHLPASLRALLAPRRLGLTVVVGAWLGFAVGVALVSLVGSTSELLLHTNSAVVLVLAMIAGTLTGGLAGWNRAWRRGRRLDALVADAMSRHAFVLPMAGADVKRHVDAPRDSLRAAHRGLDERAEALEALWHRDGQGTGLSETDRSELRQLRRAHLQLDAMVGAAVEQLAPPGPPAPFHLDIGPLVDSIDEYIQAVDALLGRVPQGNAG